MSGQVDPLVDIRAFLSQDRERIVRSIRKRTAPHLIETGHYKSSGEKALLWIDYGNSVGADLSMAKTTPVNTNLGGFVVKHVCGIGAEGVMRVNERRLLETLKFSELPYEDLMKVSSWVARRFPAPQPTIERDEGMLAFIGAEPTP